MSEIRATTISDETGNGPIALTKQSAAKAWLHFNYDDLPALKDSFNVSSLTDAGVGLCTMNYTNNFNDANYSFIGMTNAYHGRETDRAVGSSQLNSWYVSGTGGQRTNVDSTFNSSASFGDLA